MDIAIKFFVVLAGVLFLFRVAMAIGRGIKSDDDDFSGRA